MAAPAQQRCFHHPPRAAVARCPQCTRFYCRECISEHDGRMLCADCLRAQTAEADAPAARDWSGVFGVVRLAGALVLLWLLFLGVGQVVLSLPAPTHESTVWQAPPDDVEDAP